MFGVFPVNSVPVNLIPLNFFPIAPTSAGGITGLMTAVITALPGSAKNESTIVYNVKYYDGDLVLTVPKTIKWTLSDGIDNTVNNREDVSVSPGSEINIVLYGDDINKTEGTSRKLIITATYDSATYGIDNLPLVSYEQFCISDFSGASCR